VATPRWCRCGPRRGRSTLRSAGALFDEVATGNAVVVHRELVRAGTEASVRTVQRVVVDRRREEHAAAVATVRGDHAHLDHRNRSIAIAETGG